MKRSETKKPWIEVRVALENSYQDLVIGQFAALGFRGFLQEDHAVNCYVPRPDWTKALQRTFQGVLKRFKDEFAGADCSWKASVIQNRNWNAEWEKSVGIVEATSRIIIKPSWKRLRKRDKGKIVLQIDPKMAFGTGHHETTRLCLVLLEENLRKGTSVLDFGTGTGVLAIAASRLGAGTVVGIDNDSVAVENARENVRRNRVAGKITLKVGDIARVPARRFDLITANIDLPTISSSLKGLASRLKRGGILIVSGLLVSDLDAFMNLISHQGIVPLEIISENEWASICLTKADAAGSA